MTSCLPGHSLSQQHPLSSYFGFSSQAFPRILCKVNTRKVFSAEKMCSEKIKCLSWQIRTRAMELLQSFHLTSEVIWKRKSFFWFFLISKFEIVNLIKSLNAQVRGSQLPKASPLVEDFMFEFFRSFE